MTMGRHLILRGETMMISMNISGNNSSITYRSSKERDSFMTVTELSCSFLFCCLIGYFPGLSIVLGLVGHGAEILLFSKSHNQDQRLFDLIDELYVLIIASCHCALCYFSFWFILMYCKGVRTVIRARILEYI